MTFSFHRAIAGMLLLTSACDAGKGDGADTAVGCPSGHVVASDTMYDSLQDATESGAVEIVTVCSGTFEGGDFAGATGDLRIEGAGSAATQFDGEGSGGSVLSANVSGALTLSGMTVTGGVSRTNADDAGGSAGGLSLGTSDARLSDLEIRDNAADWAAGLALPSAPADGSRPEFAITDTRFVRNVAAWGGGAFSVNGPGTVTLVNVDLGAGADDNGPDDVAFFDGPPTPEAHEPLAVYQFDGVVSVTCVWETRTCE